MRKYLYAVALVIAVPTMSYAKAQGVAKPDAVHVSDAGSGIISALENPQQQKNLSRMIATYGELVLATPVPRADYLRKIVRNEPVKDVQKTVMLGELLGEQAQRVPQNIAQQLPSAMAYSAHVLRATQNRFGLRAAE